MRNETSAVQLVQSFLPSLAELMVTEHPGQSVCVLEADFDGDGLNEIAAAYRWLGESYLLMLKYDVYSWRVAANIKRKSDEVTYFQVASITGRHRNNLVVGWQGDTVRSILAVYEWTREGLKNVVKDELYFHKMYVEDMAGQGGRDGKQEIALWLHDTADAYDVCIYRWSRGKMVPAFDVYPAYFQKVARYYQQKVQELPYASFYWYYLADAQFKEGKTYKAFKSIQRAVKLHHFHPSKEKLVSLKQRIESVLFMRDAFLYPASIRSKNGVKWGYIDQQGQFVIPPQYDDAQDFQENELAIVQSGELYGVINRSGKYEIIPSYQTILPFSEKRAIVVDGSGYHVINEKGKKLTQKAYSFISSYKEGRALFSEISTQGSVKYGFLDLAGKEVIPPQYEDARDFHGGKAVVKLGENSYALIDKDGNKLQTYPYSFVSSVSEGLMAFQRNMNEKYGYMDEKGNIVIPPQYGGAQPFSGGRAVVNMSDDYQNRYGLIDKQGAFIIPPQYNDINLLGEKRVAAGKALDEKRPYIGSVYAIASTDGNLLTGFIYKGISPYEKGYASAYDDEHTFFIDRSGKVSQRFPIIPGSGSLSFIGDAIKAFVDQRLSYYDLSGRVIYRRNTIIPLNEQYEVREIKFNPNKDYLVYYPQIEGILLKVVQERVNNKLKELSGVKKIDPSVQLDSSYGGDFSITFFQKKLLVLELYGYDYPFGAAHGMPSRVYPHINLTNGRFYELKDLFKRNSNYVKVLSEYIANQIKTDPQYSYIFPDSYKGIKTDQPFYVTENTLHIYFTPYEIAPYAAGFPTFDIPFTDMMDIIDVKGEFWQSFRNK